MILHEYEFPKVNYNMMNVLELVLNRILFNNCIITYHRLDVPAVKKIIEHLFMEKNTCSLAPHQHSILFVSYANFSTNVRGC